MTQLVRFGLLIINSVSFHQTLMDQTESAVGPNRLSHILFYVQ